MDEISLCISSQTPLVRFSADCGEILRKRGLVGKSLDISNFVEGEDYTFTAGGVTRMVFPLLKQMPERGFLKNPHWVSLNPLAPEELTVGGITLNHVRIDRERLGGYGYTKEALWRTLHGILKEPPESIFWQEEFVDYTYYNRVCSELITKLDEENDFDLFYIHDFQQLPLGQMLHTLKPKIFRWHIPFDESLIPEAWRPALASYFNEYDVVVVSCKKYLESLRKFGYSGEAHHIYPYLDLGAYRKPAPEEIENFNRKFGLDQEDRILLVVARMDPIKGQDRAIAGFAKVAGDFPDLKLVLAGDGSFSSSKQGLGLSKAERWQAALKELVRDLSLEKRVIFTGHLTHAELQAAYERCELTILPSVLEGFGLVVIEGWLYKKPTIVSANAGISELIKHGENGLLFDPNDPNDLADKLFPLLSDPARGEVLGENGYMASGQCSLEEGVKAEFELMKKLV
ncbi:MAG: glycosyltransferase family 4 protein [Candidatus Hadarchaeum sp.]|uniref:glycosyltransferase family 4 protein n=1 Tax=Candidatus Hadarchaeum sp. TaxID=2883567 RepID=UPI003D0E07E4